MVTQAESDRPVEPGERVRVARQQDNERRQQVRVPLQLRATRARRWAAGAWHDLEATLVDVSSRGMGVSLDEHVQVGDRLSLSIPLADGRPELRLTLELRHVRFNRHTRTWRAGGVFRNLLPADHERIVRCLLDELRSTHPRSL